MEGFSLPGVVFAYEESVFFKLSFVACDNILSGLEFLHIVS